MSDLELFAELPSWIVRAIGVGAIVVGAFVVSRLVGLVIRRIVAHRTKDDVVADEEERQRVQTLGMVLRTASSSLIWPVALLMALSHAGIDIAPLIAAAGIGGLALGFGAQHLVRDVVAGFYVLLEDQFRVGEPASPSPSRALRPVVRN